MKHFWFVFSIFLFSLTVYPCIEDDVSEKSGTEIKGQDKMGGHSEALEHCTPFCTCSHCPASTFYISSVSYTFKKKVIPFQEKNLLGLYTSTPAQRISNKIWQPPRVS